MWFVACATIDESTCSHRDLDVTGCKAAETKHGRLLVCDLKNNTSLSLVWCVIMSYLPWQLLELLLQTVTDLCDQISRMCLLLPVECEGGVRPVLIRSCCIPSACTNEHVTCKVRTLEPRILRGNIKSLAQGLHWKGRRTPNCWCWRIQLQKPFHQWVATTNTCQ